MAGPWIINYIKHNIHVNVHTDKLWQCTTYSLCVPIGGLHWVWEVADKHTDCRTYVPECKQLRNREVNDATTALGPASVTYIWGSNYRPDDRIRRRKSKRLCRLFAADHAEKTYILCVVYRRSILTTTFRHFNQQMHLIKSIYNISYTFRHQSAFLNETLWSKNTSRTNQTRHFNHSNYCDAIRSRLELWAYYCNYYYSTTYCNWVFTRWQ